MALLIQWFGRTSAALFSTYHFGRNWNVEMLRRNESPREILSKEARKPTRNSNHIWHRLRDSNPGHNGWKLVLSLLRRPVSGKEKRQVFTWCTGIVQTRFMCSVPVSVICVPMHHAPNTWNVSSYVSFFLRVKLGNGCNRHVPCSFSELKFVGSRHWKLGENVFHELRYMKFW